MLRPRRSTRRADLRPLTMKVLAENRRYQQIRNARTIRKMALRRAGHGWECDEQLSRQSGGLSYAEMLEAAEKAGFRHALWQIAERIADIFQRIVELQPHTRRGCADILVLFRNVSRGNGLDHGIGGIFERMVVAPRAKEVRCLRC